MLYRRLIHINENGESTEFPLAVGQYGKGAPTETTEGVIGVSYLDTDSGKYYVCLDETPGAYKWGLAWAAADSTEILHNGAPLADFLYKKMSQAEYEALEAAGKVNPNTPYVIV